MLGIPEAKSAFFLWPMTKRKSCARKKNNSRKDLLIFTGQI